MKKIVFPVMILFAGSATFAADNASGLNSTVDSSANGGLLADTNTAGAHADISGAAAATSDTHTDSANMDVNANTKTDANAATNTKPAANPKARSKLKARIGVNSSMEEGTDRHSHEHDVNGTLANPDANVKTGATINGVATPAVKLR